LSCYCFTSIHSFGGGNNNCSTHNLWTKEIIRRANFGYPRTVALHSVATTESDPAIEEQEINPVTPTTKSSVSSPMNNGPKQQQQETAKSPRPNNYSWFDRIDQLRKYKEVHGDCLVPKRYKENTSLGNWVNKQRQHYRKFQEHKSSPLTQERIDILDSLEFIWDASNVKRKTSSAEKAWWKRYDELVLHFKDNGQNSVVPSKSSLGWWIIKQRNEFNSYKKGEKSILTKDRIDALNAIGFQWKSHHQQIWDKRVEELKAYKHIHGDCLVPTSYKENPKLANWVSSQRKLYNNNSLSEERIDVLEKVGFIWDRWEHEFEQKLRVEEMSSGTNL